jgi:putative hydrolase of the HAD superfamily
MNYLIWDFDGTLGYREGMWTGALFDILCRELPDHGCSIEQIRAHLQEGFPWHRHEQSHERITSAEEWWDAIDGVFERAYRGVGIEEERARRLARQVRLHYPHPGNWRLYDDTIPALDHLSRLGWKHLILSNHVPELHLIVGHLGLGNRIHRIFNSAETGYEKPHPQAFRIVLDAIESDATVWMIGDNVVADVAGAEAVGIPAILVRKQDASVKHCCSDLRDVAAVLSPGRVMRTIS